MHMASQREMAFTIYTRLSSAVVPRRPPGSGMQLAHLPNVFNEQWIASLPIPTDDKPPAKRWRWSTDTPSTAR